MIKPISSIESLEAPVRKLLIAQSELASDHVLNALNVRGPAMQKPGRTIGEVQFESFSQTDSVIIFEITESEQSDSEDLANKNDDLFITVPIKLKLIVYGKNARTLSYKLKSRLQASAVRDAFFDIGLNLTEVSDIDDATEFINDMLWIRRDFTCSFISHMTVSKVTHEDMFDNASAVSVTVDPG